MLLKNKRFFKKRKKNIKNVYVFKNTIYFLLLKFRFFFIKSLLKKLVKLSKRQKTLVYFCVKKNLIISKKSKNSRMGKGKGSNFQKISTTSNKLFILRKISKTRFFKIKKKLNFFLKKTVF
jgi:hypothetical protein